MTSLDSINVEICVAADDARAVERSVTAALDGGAATVELCAAMHLQGTTPAPEMIEAARASFGQRRGLMVMIRPRGGDFIHDDFEVELMLRQIDVAKRAGADGVVFGAIRDGKIDEKISRRLTRAARDHDLAVTVHRAFDAVAEPEAALDLLIELGIDRVLTSGLPWESPGTALDGVERIGRLLRRAGSSIEIVIGGGIAAGSVGTLLRSLPADHGRVAVHAYSSVLRSGLTDTDAVRELADAVASARRDRET